MSKPKYTILAVVVTVAVAISVLVTVLVMATDRCFNAAWLWL